MSVLFSFKNKLITTVVFQFLVLLELVFHSRTRSSFYGALIYIYEALTNRTAIYLGEMERLEVTFDLSITISFFLVIPFLFNRKYDLLNLQIFVFMCIHVIMLLPVYTMGGLGDNF